MHDEQGREMRLIYHLAQSKTPLTSEMLAGLVSVSTRTVKSDMIQVRERLVDLGAELVSRKSQGYSIKILDEEKFKSFYDQLTYNRMLLGTFVSDHLARTIFLARTLVASDDYVKLDDLADRMFLSRSSIKNEMKTISSFFNSFRLQVDSRAGKGVRIIGSEENLRLAMTELVVVHYHQIKISDSSPEYARILECDEEERQGIRRNFLKTYRESGMAATDDETLRFAFYLIVMRNRIRDGHVIRLEEKLKEELQGLVEYPLAKKVVANLQAFPGYDVCDDEICHIAMFFHCMRDLKTDDIHEGMPFLDEARILADEVVERIRWLWSIDFTCHLTLKTDLVTAFLPLLAQIRYGQSAQQSIGMSMRSAEIAGSPLAIELGRSAMRLIEEKYYCRLNVRSSIGLSFRFFGALASIRYDIRKLNLLTVSSAGKQGAIQLIQRIDHRFADMIATNTPVELYEVRGLNQHEYDCVIMNDPEFSYYYDIPYILIDTVTRPYQFNRLFDEVLVKAYQFEELIPDPSSTRVYRHFEYENPTQFFKLIAYKHGKDETYSSLLFDMLSENEKFVSYNKLGDVVAVFLPYRMAKEEGIELYSLQNNGLWGVHEVQTIIVIIHDFDGSQQKTKVIENISRQMVISKENLDELIRQPSKEVYEKMIKECLTSE